MIVLDTHAVVWWIGGDPRLSRKAAAAIRNELSTGQVGIPSIGAREIGMLVARGVSRSAMDVTEWLDAVQAIPGVVVLPLSAKIALDSTRLPGKFHDDPADRMIVAPARAENAPLATADPRIHAYRHVRTTW